MHESSTARTQRPRSLEEAVAQESSRLAKSQPLHFGFPTLDRLARPSTNQLLILGGRPGTFKTALMLTWAMNLARAGKTVAIAPLEMGEGATATAFLSRLSGVSRSDLTEADLHKRPLPPGLQAAKTAALAELATLSSRITLLPSTANGLDEITARLCLVRYDAVFVDHLGIIGGRGSQLDRIDAAIDSFRLLAHGQLVEGYHPFVCLLSPLNREIEKGGEKVRYPRMSDLRGSGNIESHADVVAITHRPNLFNAKADASLRLVILKNRNGPSPAIIDLQPFPALAWVDEAEHQVHAEPAAPAEVKR